MKIIAVVFCLMLNAGCSDNDDLTEEPPGPVHNENISIGSGNPELMLAWKENTGYTVTIAGFLFARLFFSEKAFNLFY